MLNRHPNMPSLAQVLMVEDDLTFVDMLCPTTGLPLWPQVRVAYVRAILSDLVYGVQLTGKTQSRIPALRASATLARSVAHNVSHRWRRPRHSPICVFGDGVGNQLVDGKWFNRLAGHFVAERPHQTLVVEDHFEWRWPFPRDHDNVLLHAPWQVANNIAGRLKVGAQERRLAAQLIDLVNARAAHHLQWALGTERQAGLVAMLARKIAALPYQVATYSRFLDQVRPKILVVNAACYGPAAALLAVAKSKDIVTAEFQHGVISPGHDAYNFGPAVLASERYRATLPDYLLTYGNWWSEQTNAPVKKVVIGNPQRTIRTSTGGTTRKTDLLVLSDGLKIDRYLDLVRSIATKAAQAGLRPVLRPHPLERTQLSALPARLTEGVIIDTNADIYTSFKNARVVVSEASTGLFEAIGIADHIFMWATPRTNFVYPKYPFLTFDNAESLGLLLEQERIRSACLVDPSDIWADGWASRYDDFLIAHGVVSCLTTSRTAEKVDHV